MNSIVATLHDENDKLRREKTVLKIRIAELEDVAKKSSATESVKIKTEPPNNQPDNTATINQLKKQVDHWKNLSETDADQIHFLQAKLTEEETYGVSQREMKKTSQAAEGNMRQHVKKLEKKVQDAEKRYGKLEDKLGKEQELKRSAEARLVRAKEEVRALKARQVGSGAAAAVRSSSSTPFGKRMYGDASESRDDSEPCVVKRPRVDG